MITLLRTEFLGSSPSLEILSTPLTCPVVSLRWPSQGYPSSSLSLKSTLRGAMLSIMGFGLELFSTDQTGLGKHV